jgi:hypothetical protein
MKRKNENIYSPIIFYLHIDMKIDAVRKQFKCKYLHRTKNFIGYIAFNKTDITKANVKFDLYCQKYQTLFVVFISNLNY